MYFVNANGIGKIIVTKASHHKLEKIASYIENQPQNPFISALKPNLKITKQKKYLEVNQGILIIIVVPTISIL